MKAKILLHSKVFFYSLVLFLIIFGGLSSYGYEWSKTFGKTNIAEEGYSVQQTNDGGYIIAGYSGALTECGTQVYLIKTDAYGKELWSKTFVKGPAKSVQQTTDGGYIITGYTTICGTVGDAFLIKTDAIGNVLWTKTFGGGNGSDWGNSVQQTTDGGYIIVGSTGSFGTGWYNIYLIKTDKNGNEQWNKIFGGSEDDTGNSVQQTTDGGYIIVGKTESFGAGYGDVYLIKTDKNGNEQWSKTFGGSDFDWGQSVQQTVDGGYIITGKTFSFGGGQGDVYMIKTDKNGNELWNETFGGSAESRGNSVQQTTDGGYIITGWTRSLSTSGDVYLIKTDKNGNELWNETFGGSGYDIGSSVQQTIDGGYIIAGTYDYDDVYLIYYNPDRFIDVPPGYWAEDAIYKIFNAGITTGCSKNPLKYCPGDPVTRAQMAIFLLRSKLGSSYTPPPATGIFTDVPVGSFAADWIEDLFNRGITTGCEKNPLKYCPGDPVTRAQMAIFLLRSKLGCSYTPPPATGNIFTDVPVGSFAADWIEDLFDQTVAYNIALKKISPPARRCDAFLWRC